MHDLYIKDIYILYVYLFCLCIFCLWYETAFVPKVWLCHALVHLRFRGKRSGETGCCEVPAKDVGEPKQYLASQECKTSNSERAVKGFGALLAWSPDGAQQRRFLSEALFDARGLALWSSLPRTERFITIYIVVTLLFSVFGGVGRYR